MRQVLYYTPQTSEFSFEELRAAKVLKKKGASTTVKTETGGDNDTNPFASNLEDNDVKPDILLLSNMNEVDMEVIELDSDDNECDVNHFFEVEVKEEVQSESVSQETEKEDNSTNEIISVEGSGYERDKNNRSVQHEQPVEGKRRKTIDEMREQVKELEKRLEEAEKETRKLREAPEALAMENSKPTCSAQTCSNMATEIPHTAMTVRASTETRPHGMANAESSPEILDAAPEVIQSQFTFNFSKPKILSREIDCRAPPQNRESINESTSFTSQSIPQREMVCPDWTSVIRRNNLQNYMQCNAFNAGCSQITSFFHRYCDRCPQLKVITLKDCKINPEGALVKTKIEGAENLDTTDKLFNVLPIMDYSPVKISSSTLRVFDKRNHALAVLTPTAEWPMLIPEGTVIGRCQLLNKDASERIKEPTSCDVVLKSDQDPRLKLEDEQIKKFRLRIKGGEFIRFRGFELVQVEACREITGQLFSKFSIKNRLAIVQPLNTIELVLKNETLTDISDLSALDPIARITNINKIDLDVLGTLADYVENNLNKYRDPNSVQSNQGRYQIDAKESEVVSGSKPEVSQKHCDKTLQFQFSSPHVLPRCSHGEDLEERKNVSARFQFSSPLALREVDKNAESKRRPRPEVHNSKKTKRPSLKRKSRRSRSGPYLLSLRGIEIFIGINKCKKCDNTLSCLCSPCWRNARKTPRRGC